MADVMQEMVDFFGIPTNAGTFPEMFEMILSSLLCVYMVLAVVRALVSMSGHFGRIW